MEGEGGGDLREQNGKPEVDASDKSRAHHRRLFVGAQHYRQWEWWMNHDMVAYHVGCAVLPSLRTAEQAIKLTNTGVSGIFAVA